MSQEDNSKKEELYKKKKYKGLTILENVKEYLPQDISRNDIKGMVYNALGNSIVNKNVIIFSFGKSDTINERKKCNYRTS